MYAGLAILFFYLVIFLQQVAGYSAFESGFATLLVTLVMFALSRRFGALADRMGPRLVMGAGPLIAAAGVLLLLRTGTDTSYLGDLLPSLVVFSLGLALTVSPLTATVLADADETDAGIASAVNNAVARVAGLVGVSLVGVVVARQLAADTFAADAGSVRAFHEAVLICAGLVAAGAWRVRSASRTPGEPSKPSAALEASSSGSRNPLSTRPDPAHARRTGTRVPAVVACVIRDRGGTNG